MRGMLLAYPRPKHEAPEDAGYVIWDWSSFLHYLHSPYLMIGALISLALSIGAMVIGLVLGGCAAMMRMSERRWVRAPASAYVWLFRGTPVLVQLIIIYTGLPQLGLQLGVVASALIGLGVNEGAYLAEIIRSGISAVPKGQFEAARAIGMTWPKTMRVVVLPQALRIIIPPVGNAFNGLMKTSSLASVISMEELLRRTELLVQVQFKVLEIFIVAALYYLVLTTLWGLVQQRLEAYASRSVADEGASRPARLGLQRANLAVPNDAA
jgi:polar amino acid transport system permease protein